MLVSSANSLYFGCLVNHIGSAQLREPGLRIVIYDMGFDELERMVLQVIFLHRVLSLRTDLKGTLALL